MNILKTHLGLVSLTLPISATIYNTCNAFCGFPVSIGDDCGEGEWTKIRLVPVSVHHVPVQ